MAQKTTDANWEGAGARGRVNIRISGSTRVCKIVEWQMRDTGVSGRAERGARKLEFVGKSARSIEAAIWQSRATTTRGSVFKGKNDTNLTCVLSHLASNHIERHISLTPTPSELSLHET